jgi:DNA polymerase III subunit gamma/tau
MIIGAVALLVVAAAGAAVAVLSHGGQPASALGSRGTANPATVAAPSAGVAAQPTAAPSSAAPARSVRAAPAPATSAPATPAPARSAAVAAASGGSRESYGLASPAGWRHGFPSGWGGRGWVWGSYRGGTYFRGPWW